MKINQIVIVFFFLSFNFTLRAQQDTLRVMSYNVLNYGDGCQGTNQTLHGYLKTIVSFIAPDILGMVKMASIQRTPTDFTAISPYGFCDSIVKYAFNSTFPGRYSYCTLTNVLGQSKMNALFYNKNKLGFLTVKTLCTIAEDFDLYKFFYHDPNLATTKDTTFLYVLLNHTQSGTPSGPRDQQDSINLNALRGLFSYLPNLIDMGDFNLHNSAEPGYQYAINPVDTAFKFSDPPFHPDNNLTYPIDWDNSPSLCPAYLTTSTRLLANVPNICGTSGGAKSWYDHMLFSPWIVHNSNYIKYIPNSYKAVGNDGHRLSVSINDSSLVPKNTSAPGNVIDALFHLSNKYPIMSSLAVTHNSTGVSPPDPTVGVKEISAFAHNIKIANPVEDELHIIFPEQLVGQNMHLTWNDLSGKCLKTEYLQIHSSTFAETIDLTRGLYILSISIQGEAPVYFKIVKL
jgi:hypothetical protein